MSDESRHERELGGQLLASVSRSFYLTLKALPAGLREPLSLAYLLARTADTLADTVTVPAATRLECLRLYESCAQGAASASESGELSARIAREFAPLQSDAAERRLMERFAGALAWLGIMRPGPLRAIRGVLHHIIHGQMLDIERFPADGRLRALPDAAALDEYTWLVAGCVGEFWTDMCATESPGALEADVSLDEMKKWGAAFGKGLQLVNILRDVGEDLFGVLHHRCGVFVGNPPSALAGKQANPVATFEVGNPLREGRRRHAKRGRRLRPRAVTADGDEVGKMGGGDRRRGGE